MSVGITCFGFENPIADMAGHSRPQNRLTYSARGNSEGAIRNEKTAVQIPFQFSEQRLFSIGGAYHRMTLREGLVLPGTEREVPSRLENAEVNFSATQKLESNETLGARFFVGSSSDRPFDGAATTSLKALAFWSFPSESTPSDRWILSLNYSNNNSFTTLPIPGFAYLSTRPGLTLVYGLPFAYVRWRPQEEGPWTFSGFYLLTTLKLEATYGPPYLNTFLRFDWGQESWMRSDREDTEDRLTYDEKKLAVGGRAPLAPWLLIEAESGFAFE